MDDPVADDLARRAERGATRGPGAVLRSARGDAGDDPGRRRWTPVAAVAVATAAAVLVGALVATRSDDDGTPVAGEATTTSTTTLVEDEPVVAQSASSLVRFDSCPGVLAQLKEQALERVGPYGLQGVGNPLLIEDGAFVQRSFSPTALASASGTNTQEAGIDEPDLVETDGERLYDVRRGDLRVLDIASARLEATIPLHLVAVAGALLVGDQLVVIANEPLADYRRSEAKVVVVDVSGPPVVEERLTIDGAVVDARVVDGRVHVVTESFPSLAFTYPLDGDQASMDAATAANQDRIHDSTLADWLPTSTVVAADGTVVEDHAQLTDCDDIRRPQEFSGFGQTSLVTLDLDSLADSSSTAVQASSTLVYASADSLYVASFDHDDAVAFRAGAVSPAAPHTDLHRFSLDGSPAYVGSGRVEGWVRDSYGLSEHDGHLRVASTTFGDVVSTRVTVLRLGEGALTVTGTVLGLGIGEDLEGIRFVGDLAYLVTFRRTDPLHVLDLRDPFAPHLAGVLQVPGYSAYLHPVGDGLLLGVGHDGTDSGRLTGAAASLVDVHDPAAPTRLALQRFGPAAGPALEDDPHAFLWWPETQTAYIPVGVAGVGGRVEVVQVADGALVLAGEIAPVGAASPGDVAFDRVVIAGDRLLSVSPQGVQISDGASLAPIAWVPYP